MTTTNNPTANPNLTDAECDAILHRSGVDVLLYRTAINDVDWTLYRSSQYASFDEAVRHGAIASERDVLGYFDAVDVIGAIMSAIDLMDYRASEDDVRIVITIDDVRIRSVRLTAISSAKAATPLPPTTDQHDHHTTIVRVRTFQRKGPRIRDHLRHRNMDRRHLTRRGIPQAA